MPPRRAATHAFTARLVRSGILYCVDIPAAVSRAFGVRGYVPVAGTVNRKTPFRASLAPAGGGRHRLLLNGEVRSAANIALGERVTLHLHRDEQPRELPLPEDLATALRDEGVLATFQALAPGKRFHIIAWVEKAVHETTREKRVARTVEVALAEHEKRLDRTARS